MKQQFLIQLATLLLISSSAFGQSVFWYDGDTQIPLWAVEAGSSPLVFRETSALSGPKLRLTGRVIVRFHSQPSAELQARLISYYGLRFERDMGLGAVIWLYSAPNVADSLMLANRLVESGEVAAAFPDWEDVR